MADQLRDYFSYRLGVPSFWWVPGASTAGTGDSPRKVFGSLPAPPAFIDDSPEFSGQQALRDNEAAPAAGGGGAAANWDLYYDADTELYYVRNPAVFLSNTDVESEVVITNAGGTPAAGDWVVLQTTSASMATASLLFVSDWTTEGFPSVYKFDTSTPFALEYATFPLWRFYDKGDLSASELAIPGKYQFVGGVNYGRKLVGSSPLKVGFTMEQVPSQSVVRSVPYLIGF